MSSIPIAIPAFTAHHINGVLNFFSRKWTSPQSPYSSLGVDLLQSAAAAYRAVSFADPLIAVGLIIFSALLLCNFLYVLWPWKPLNANTLALQSTFLGFLAEEAQVFLWIAPIAYALMRASRDPDFVTAGSSPEYFYNWFGNTLLWLARAFNSRTDLIRQRQNMALKERFTTFALVRGLVGRNTTEVVTKAMADYTRDGQVPPGAPGHDIWGAYNSMHDSDCSVDWLFENEIYLKDFGHRALMDHPNRPTIIDKNGKIVVPFGTRRGRVRWFFEQSAKDNGKVVPIRVPPPDMPGPRVQTYSAPGQAQDYSWKEWLDLLRFGDKPRRLAPVSPDNHFGRWIELLVNKMECVSLDYEPQDKQGVRDVDYPDASSEPPEYRYPLGGQFQRMMIDDETTMRNLQRLKMFYEHCTNYARGMVKYEGGYERATQNPLERPILEQGEEDELEDIDKWDFTNGPRPMKLRRNSSDNGSHSDTNGNFGDVVAALLSTILPRWLYAPPANKFLTPSEFEHRPMGHTLELGSYEAYPLPEPLPANTLVWPHFFGSHEKDANETPIKCMPDPDLMEARAQLEALGIRLPNMVEKQTGVSAVKSLAAAKKVVETSTSWLKTAPKPNSRLGPWWPSFTVEEQEKGLEAMKKELRRPLRRVVNGFVFGEKAHAGVTGSGGAEPELLTREWFGRLLPAAHSSAAAPGVNGWLELGETGKSNGQRKFSLST